MTTRKKAIIALIIANIIWGAASPIFKWSLQNIPPFTLAFLRFSLGAILILPFAYKNLYIAKEDLWSVAKIGIFGIFINITFFFLGLELTSSINAPIIASTGPIFLLILSAIFLKEKPKKILIKGTIISLIGVIFIIFEPLFEKGLDGNILGNFYLVLATLGAVFYVLTCKQILKKYDAAPITFWSFIVGTTLFIPLFLKEAARPDFLHGLGMQGIIGIVFGAVFSSAMAYLLYEWAIKYIQVNETGIFTYIDPVVAVVIALPLLGEKITPIFILGSAFVFLGIIIAQGKFHYHYIIDLFKKNGIMEKINN